MFTNYFLRVALILCLLVPASVHASGSVQSGHNESNISSCGSSGTGADFVQSSGGVSSCLAGWLAARPSFDQAVLGALQFTDSNRVYYSVDVHTYNGGWYLGWWFSFSFATGCPPNSTNCVCNSGYVPNSAATACVSDCPHTYLGIPVSGGYTFTTTDVGAGYQGCDNFGCSINVSQLARIFGVSLVMQSVSSNACPNSAQPGNPPVTTLSVSFTSADDQQKLKFEAVGAKAALVDSSAVSAATSNAQAAAAAAPAHLAGVESDMQQVTSAATARDNAYNAVQTAANNFFNAPSSSTLSAYNSAMSTYNNAVNNLNPLITVLYSDYSVAAATKIAADSAILTSKSVNDNVTALNDAISASGQAFDTAAVAAHVGDTTALNTAVTTAETALSDAGSRLTTVQTSGNEVILNTTTITNNINVMATAVQTVSTGAETGLPTAPAGDYCAANPTAVQCLVPPEPSFCESNPDAVQCAGLGEVGDSALGTKSISVVITPVAVGGAGACPAPSPMVLHGQTYFFKWDTYCNYATGIKPILLAFGWLSAAGILVGGFKS